VGPTDAYQVTQDGQPLATILPASAHDADGWPIPVSQTVVGDDLQLEVDVAGSDPHFPITVDPLTHDNFSWYTNNCDDPNPGWQYWDFGAGNPYFGPYQGNAYLGCGNYIRDNTGHFYGGNEYGWFHYGVPGNQSEAQVTAFHGDSWLDEPAGADMCIVWGVAQIGYWTAQSIDCGGAGAKNVDFTTPSGINVYWEVVAHTDGTRVYDAVQRTSYVTISDSTQPQSVSFPGLSWTDDPGATFSATVTDSGVGIASGSLSLPGSSWGGGSSSSSNGCSRGRCNASISLTGTVGNLLEGDNQIQVQATDLAGNTRTATGSVKVDKSAPVITPSGTLYAAANQTLTAGSYTFTPSAADGSASPLSAPRSGVRTLQILLDGATVHSAYQECPNGSCSLSDSWTYSPVGQPAGVHTVETVATDQLGHQSVASFNFSVGPCCLQAVANWTPTGAPASVIDTRYADANGDGIRDLIDRVSGGGLSVALSTGTGFRPPTTWGNLATNQTRYAADVNGDALDDVIGITNGGTIGVELSSGSSFGALQSWGTQPNKTRPFFADADGDGRADLVVQSTQTGSIQVGLSTGTAFGPLVTWGTAPTTSELVFSDADRDGFDDLVTRNTSTGSVQVGLSTSTSFAALATWGSLPAADDLYIGDVNKDLAADLVGRNRTTGAIDVALSTTSAFAAAQSGGTWPLTNDMQLADVTADGEADVIGRNATLGQVNVAVMNTAQPVGARVLAPPLDPAAAYDPEGINGGSAEMSPVPDDPTASASSVATIRYELGFEDERLRTLRGSPDVNAIYTTLKQAGVSVIRFKAYWGELQNPNHSSIIAGSKLATAVAAAGAAGFKVELAITGRVTNDCPFDDPQSDLGCSLPAAQGTGYNPDPAAFRTFVNQAVTYFSSAARGSGQVLRYSLWNEPNNGNFLDLSSTSLPALELRYRKLYQQGYLGVHDGASASSCGCHPRIFFGELSQLDRGHNGTAHLTPLDFMTGVLTPDPNDATDTDGLVTSGVAYHPYQHYYAPTDAHDYGIDVGVGRLPDIAAAVKGQYNAGRVGNNHRRIKTARGYIPNVFLTEFGYLNRRTAPLTAQQKQRHVRYWHSEGERASWLPSALSLANDPRNRVRQLVLYHATELRPEEAPNSNYNPADPNDSPYQDRWDSGMIDKGGSPTGDRGYGADAPTGKPVVDPGYSRSAFCAVWKWMKENNRNSADLTSPCASQ
jgi:hypothetical protein